jgi:hypothetical protein
MPGALPSAMPGALPSALPSAPPTGAPATAPSREGSEVRPPGTSTLRAGAPAGPSAGAPAGPGATVGGVPGLVRGVVDLVVIRGLRLRGGERGLRAVGLGIQGVLAAASCWRARSSSRPVRCLRNRYVFRATASRSAAVQQLVRRNLLLIVCTLRVLLLFGSVAHAWRVRVCFLDLYEIVLRRVRSLARVRVRLPMSVVVVFSTPMASAARHSCTQRRNLCAARRVQNNLHSEDNGQRRPATA